MQTSWQVEMARPSSEPRDELVLVIAPFRQDAAAICAILARGGLQAKIVQALSDLQDEVKAGAGAVIVAEEALRSPLLLRTLVDALAGQPAWSEVPLLLVASSHVRATATTVQDRVGGYANVILLERPLRSATLLSTLHSALRARQRQYQIRDHLAEKERHEQELLQLNATLEQRVTERSRALEDALARREQAEKALIHAQKAEAMGQITGGVAHDFNNLLMVFTGGLTLLEKKWNDLDQRKRIITSMRQAADRGQALTRQLLAFARKIKLQPEAIDFHELLDGLRVLVGGALRGDISVAVDVEENLWTVFADRTQLELALLNLAVNARDAMPQGGTVTITARNKTLSRSNGHSLNGDFVAISVSDTGMGIARDVIDRIFDPFFTTKPIGKGTGLGLSQVYGFARQSGGTVSVSSEVGRGTTIEIILPRSATEIAMEASDRGGTTHPAAAPLQKSVLLVEDNDEVATISREMLVTLGLDVEHAINAREALSRLAVNRYDALLTDVVMPGGINGVDLAREAAVKYPEMAIVLTSGYAEALQTADGNGFPLLEKPFQFHLLEKTMREVLA